MGGGPLQRLFSTFANGWPGIGLLLQRLVTSAVLLYSAVAHLKEPPEFASITPQMLGAVAGVLLLVGLWTPVVGVAVALLEAWIALSGPASPSVPILLSALGATLAMIGPGAWSIDARLFGRKHIETPVR